MVDTFYNGTYHDGVGYPHMGSIVDINMMNCVAHVGIVASKHNVYPLYCDNNNTSQQLYIFNMLFQKGNCI